VQPLRIELDDPDRDDVRDLLAHHLAFAHEQSPPEDVHALDVSALQHPSISFYGARLPDGRLVGVGALKALTADHGELKSMHTSEIARGQGIGRAMLEHLLAVARDRGYRRVSLETGTVDAFVPARTMYESVGFRPCPPFADYRAGAYSVCMTLALD
jgi:putative acetyltransferase